MQTTHNKKKRRQKVHVKACTCAFIKQFFLLLLCCCCVVFYFTINIAVRVYSGVFKIVLSTIFFFLLLFLCMRCDAMITLTNHHLFIQRSVLSLFFFFFLFFRSKTRNKEQKYVQILRGFFWSYLNFILIKKKKRNFVAIRINARCCNDILIAGWPLIKKKK